MNPLAFIRKYPALAGGVLSVIVFLLYSPTRGFQFVTYDDDLYVTDNERLPLGFTLDNLKWACTSLEISNWHPVTWLSHMLDFRLFGLNPGPHHLVSAALHSANAFFLFCLLRAMTGAVGRSLFVSALFALHPIQVDSVAWIAERKNLLSLLFGILAVWLYVIYKRDRSRLCYLGAFGCFALAIMSKSMLVTLPCVLLLLDYWPLRLKATGAPSTRRTDLDHRLITELWKKTVEKAPFFVLSAISSILTLKASRLAGDLASIDSLGLSERATNALVAYVSYLGKILWPARLAVFYPLPSQNPPVWQILVSVLLLGGLSILVLLKLRSAPFLFTGWFWFLGTLVPVIGVLQVGGQLMADRYAYFPSIGLFIAVAWATSAQWERFHWGRNHLAALAVAVVTAYATVTCFQLPHWASSYDLFGHALRVTDNNFVAHDQYAYALSQRGHTQEAMWHYERSIECNPRRTSFERQCASSALVRLGDLLEASNDQPSAIRKYRAAIESDPRNAAAYNSLGLALARDGRTSEAIALYRQGATFAGPPKQHAAIYLNLGHTLSRLGRRSEAVESYLAATRWEPGNAEAHVLLGGLLYIERRIDEAVTYLLRGVQIRPNATAYFLLGAAMIDKGRTEEAVSFFRKTLELKPDHVEAQRRLQLALESMDRASSPPG